MIHFGTIIFDWNTFTDSSVSDWRCSLKIFFWLGGILFVNRNVKGIFLFNIFYYFTLTTIKLGFCRSPSTAKGIQFLSNLEQKYHIGWDRSIPVWQKLFEYYTLNIVTDTNHIRTIYITIKFLQSRTIFTWHKWQKVTRQWPS